MATNPGLLKKPSSQSSKPGSGGKASAADAKALDQKLAEAAERLKSQKSEVQIWKRFEEPLEVTQRMKQAPITVRLCNAAYLGDLKSLGSLLEQAKQERIARDQSEREEEERARIAAEAEEWTTDVNGRRFRKHHSHDHSAHRNSNQPTTNPHHKPIPIGPDGKPLSGEALNQFMAKEYEAKQARDVKERERREYERMCRKEVMDEPAFVRFQWGEEGVRVVKLDPTAAAANGGWKYSFRLDLFGVPAPPLFYACMTGQIEAVRLLKKYGADASESVEVRWPDREDETPLGPGANTPNAATANGNAPPLVAGQPPPSAAAAVAAHAGIQIGAVPTSYGSKVRITAWDVAFENGHHDVAAELGVKRQCRACTSPASDCIIS